MKLFTKETVLRKVTNRDFTITIAEIQRNDKRYCRTHMDFETSNNIHDKSFEELCAQYGFTKEDVLFTKRVDEIKALYKKEKNRTRVLYRVLKYLSPKSLLDAFDIAFNIAPHFVTTEDVDWTSLWQECLDDLKDVGYVSYGKVGEIIVK